jgi:RNA polymerase sigma factor (sigma-70 family)
LFGGESGVRAQPYRTTRPDVLGGWVGQNGEHPQVSATVKALNGRSGTNRACPVSFLLMTDMEELFRRHTGAAMKAAWLVTHDAGIAEDLVQEAFVKCAARLGGIRDVTGFGSYWQRAVLRLAANETRRLGYERRLIERLGSAQALQRVSPPADEGVARIVIGDALRSLTPRQRAVIVARFYLDLTEADTATALGMRLGTVKSTTSRALAALRLVMAEEVNP